MAAAVDAMLYYSPEFIVLLAATLAAYGAAPSPRARRAVLLASSLAFTVWGGVFDALVLAGVLLATWLPVALAERFPAARGRLVAAGIALVTANLVYWKYTAWALGEAHRVFPGLLGGREPVLPLPIGISFITLQSVAYLIDYGREQAPYAGLPRLALFKAFFAQLVAGPVVRARQLLPQLEALARPSSRDLALGIALFTFGFFKKVAVADRLGFFVDGIFASPGDYGRGVLFKALLGYSVQLWADFSGYTDMGIGAALMFGVRLPENFLSPYFSRTPSEFWQRWHITLSLWIRDYVFTPMALAFTRRTSQGVFLAALATMLLAGFWHGAGWHYPLFGFYHGALLILERKVRFPKAFSPSPALKACLQVPFMFCLTLGGWVIFRSESPAILWAFVKGLALGGGHTPMEARGFSIYLGLAFCFATQALLYVDLIKEDQPVLSALGGAWRRSFPRMEAPGAGAGALAGLALAGLFAGTILLRSSQARAFIYFQF